MGTHADAGPSGASGWLNCPAYVTRTRGRHRKATAYTREGTAAHAVAEQRLLGQTTEIGMVVEVEGEQIEVTEEMLDHVDTYIRLADLLRQDADFFQVEARVSLDWLYHPHPMPEPVFGTADLISHSKGLLSVVDLKYGAGYSVSAVGNPQLRIYAIGAIGELKEWFGPDYYPESVRTIIVQPRGTGPSVRVEEISTQELMEWANDILRPAIQRIADGDETEVPGDHCKWCVRAGECDGLHKKALAVAKMAFGEAAPPAPATLDNAEIADVLEHAEMISAWVSKVRAEVSGRIDNGQQVPGWKLVPKRGVRKWVNEEQAAEKLVYAGLPARELYKPSVMKSPAQIEKILSREALPKELLDDVVTKESSGNTLVREIDEREAIETSAKSIFEAIEPLD